MHALEIKDLVKVYSNGVRAVNEINLTVKEGDFFALLGPNGAGKSTAIGIITQLVRKTSGQVKVCGFDIESHSGAAKACIGLVPQEFNFNQFEKVIEIVTNQAGFYGISYKQALKKAELYLSKLGLWEKRFSIARTLSGGMKHRLMIARALLHEPKILILDEPTAGVDVELRRATWSFLQEMNIAGRTIILTTHYLEEAEHLCKGLAIINKGSILQHTTVKDFINTRTYESLILDLAENIKDTELNNFNNTNFAIKKIDNTTIEVTYPHNYNLNQLFEFLNLANIKVKSLRNKVNRLEELFIQCLSIT